MALPTYDDLIGVMKTDYVDLDGFMAELSNQMGDEEVVRAGHRFDGKQHSFVFHVPGHPEGPALQEALLESGWLLLSTSYNAGYMPKNYMVDYQNAFYGTQDVIGYPSFKWAVIQVTKAPDPEE